MDSLIKCHDNTNRALFPHDVDNMFFVLLTNITHILGVLFIIFGIFLPPYLLKYYILYIVFLFITYVLIDNHCFMTVISNYLGNKLYDALCIDMYHAKIILGMYLLLALLMYKSPEYSLNVLLINF